MNDIRTELVAQVAGLRRYALALTREASEAEDLVQETLTRAIAAAASWRPGTDLRAWLARIMRNAWLDALRRRGTRERAEADGPDPVSAATQHLHVEVRRAFEALRSLPGAQREAIALVAFQDMRYAEAADAMGVPLGTFMSRLARGREALRRRLEGGDAPGSVRSRARDDGRDGRRSRPPRPRGRRTGSGPARESVPPPAAPRMKTPPRPFLARVPTHGHPGHRTRRGNMTGRFDLPNGDAAPDPVLLAVGAGTAAAPSDVAAVAPPALAPAPRPPAAATAAIRHASAIRQVLLHVTPDHHPGQQLAVGVDVAARFGAKLVALYPIRRPLALRRMLEPGSPAGPVGRDGAPHGTLPGTPPGTHGGAERLRRVADLARAAVLRHMLPAGSPVVAAAVEAERAKARAVFDRLSRVAGPARVELEWHAVEGDAGALLSEVGSFHDLIVAPAGDARPGEADPDPTRRAASRSGRPVLAVPRGWASPRVGRRVLVLWNGTREAALAARAALPFLATAESVTVLTTPDRSPLDVAGLPVFGLGDFLWRHGVVAATTPFETAGAEPARALLDHAAAGGADLVVSGAFGPWPTHGWRLAGFTRALLAQARTPLLLCH